jgi:hypothetical protein
MLLFYMLKAYQTLSFKSQLSTVEQDWAKVEPKVTAAHKRAEELTQIINATGILDKKIENRFLWAPLLQTISACVAPNVQLTSLDGTVNEDRIVRLAIEGVAAGAEPRAAAEEFRQLLSERLGQSYKDVNVEFKSLEDLDSPVMLAGVSTPIARYSISLSLTPENAAGSKTEADTATPAPRKPKK